MRSVWKASAPSCDAHIMGSCHAVQMLYTLHPFGHAATAPEMFRGE